MSRIPDYELRSTVVQSLRDYGRPMAFRDLKLRAGGTDWNLRMALNYLIESDVVSKRGKSGVLCDYSLTGRAFDSGRPRAFDASGLMQVWR